MQLLNKRSFKTPLVLNETLDIASQRIRRAGVETLAYIPVQWQSRSIQIKPPKLFASRGFKLLLSVDDDSLDSQPYQFVIKGLCGSTTNLVPIRI